jgi:hypothetical protein
VNERELSNRLRPGEHLVCYDYGMGGLWGVLIAPSVSAILGRYPELDVASTWPKWLEEDRLQAMQEDPLWLDDDPPQGLLRALVADREHH